MSLAELLPQIQELSQSDKQELMLLLQRDLPANAAQDVLIAGQEYPVWSPYNCSEAANTLMNRLK
jgi:hypothetical protein